MTNKCRDGREGVQMEDAKRADYDVSELILIGIYVELVASTCPDEIVPIVEYCNAKNIKFSFDSLFCVWNGLLIIIDADADKCAEVREKDDFNAKCGIQSKAANRGGQIGQMFAKGAFLSDH
ncbi:hypothetical protein GPALN_004433 [Globodera pallida]|nr:hypothetical protein GPALN_004433 [Globodera pallida]